MGFQQETTRITREESTEQQKSSSSPQCLSERKHSQDERALPLADPQGNPAMLQPKKPPSVKGLHSLYRFCNAFQNRSAPFLTECTSHKTDIFTGCIVFNEGCLPSLFAEPA